MARIIICVLMVVAAVSAYRHHPKFPKSEDHSIALSRIKVACTSDNIRERDQIIEEAKCGEPKNVFVHLDPKAAHEQVTPGAVWVKRCVGLCEFSNTGSCIATEKRIRYIPIRIFNGKTSKETCATYPVEEHVSCGCCALGPDGCTSSQVFNPRKCTCQCPDMEKRRTCLKKRNQRWNRFKCICEERKRPHL